VGFELIFTVVTAVVYKNVFRTFYYAALDDPGFIWLYYSYGLDKGELAHFLY
jgi:hypothetical protein